MDMNSNRIDYKLWEYDCGRTGKIKVFVTVVSKIIDNYISILKELRLKPIAVDIPSNSVSKFFKFNIDTGEESTAKRLKYSKHKTTPALFLTLVQKQRS